MKLEKKVYANPEEKRKDLYTGIGVFVVVNIVLYTIVPILNVIFADRTSESFGMVGSVGIWFVFVLPLLVNIILLVYFAITRSWIALGMLAALGVVLALGIIGTVACFVLEGSAY